MKREPHSSTALRAHELSSSAPSAVDVPAALVLSQLYRRADASALNFKTTAELMPLDGLVGQQRALGALQFGTQIRKSGFNLFVIGSPGSRMQEVVDSMLRSVQWDRPTPSDWVYVNNFDDSRAAASPGDLSRRRRPACSCSIASTAPCCARACPLQI